jgi:hypothetical protein
MENQDRNPRETSTFDFFYFFLKWFRGLVSSKIRQMIKQTCNK